ncbi:MAG: hypothetical protein E7330_08020 [Clostridiales bacterium]|nr:hypothetical protein [Clostridiales bacterium]
MKKQLVSIFCAAAVLLLFSGCGKPGIPAESSPSPVPSASSAPAAVPEETAEPAAGAGQDALNAMLAYLEWQYTVTGGRIGASDEQLSENMGNLFALKAIRKAIGGETFGQADGSGLIYAALEEAYILKGLGEHHPFAELEKSAKEQYRFSAEYGLFTESNSLAASADAMKTGDLLFWADESGDACKVSLLFRQGDSLYSIETEPDGTACISDLNMADDAHRFLGYARLNTKFTAAYEPESGSSQILSTEKVLFNCPPTPPEAPAKRGYSFMEWQPSVSDGMRKDTTYTAVYAPASEGESTVTTPSPAPEIDFSDPETLVLEKREGELDIPCETIETGTIVSITENSITYEIGYYADVPDWGPELISTGELVTLSVDDESQFWTLGLLEYFTLGRVNQAVFTEWFNETGGTFMEFRSTGGKLLAGVEVYVN